MDADTARKLERERWIALCKSSGYPGALVLRIMEEQIDRENEAAAEVALTAN
jgi:hypothetical protein